MWLHVETRDWRWIPHINRNLSQDPFPISMKLFTISLASVAFSLAVPATFDNSTLEGGIEKRQDYLLCACLCCEIGKYAGRRFAEYRQRKAEARMNASRPQNWAWYPSTNTDQYDVPLVRPNYLSRTPITSTTAPASLETEVARIEDTVATDGTESRIQSNLATDDTGESSIANTVATDQAVKGPQEIPLSLQGENSDWHRVIGPLFIEGGNVAQWIMFRKEAPVISQRMLRGNDAAELQEIIFQHARHSQHSRRNKPWRPFAPSNNQFDLDPFTDGGNCAWDCTVGGFESKDGKSVHWFRVKRPTVEGKVTPTLGPREYLTFIEKSKDFRRLLDITI